MSKTVESVFRPNPGPQTAFYRSEARIVAYGGAMGGGKSRAFCEKALDIAIENPGCPIVIARQSHTSIIETTRKTMFEEVLPPDLIAGIKKSQGEDFVDLYTPVEGVLSRIHFIGLDDPGRWFSAQLGVLMVDQAEECSEDTIVKLMTRLRHPKAPQVSYSGTLGMPCFELRKMLESNDPRLVETDFDLPASDTALVRVLVRDYALAGRAFLSYNPENPGHWLEQWVVIGSERTSWGYRKPELVASDAEFPLGDLEFFFAKATDNRHLAPGYVAAQLAGLPEHLRRRYLDGAWTFVSGNCFFDGEAIEYYRELSETEKPLLTGVVAGSIEEDIAYRLKKSGKPKDKIRVVRGPGPLIVWRSPVKEKFDEATEREVPAHRYIVTVDPSSGKGADSTGIHVIDVDAFEQVAEYQGKATPDVAAEIAYRLGRIYNDALIVCEITGGWGFATDQKLREMRYPKPYTRRVVDRLTKKYTDKLGFDTNKRTRGLILAALEEAIREREFGLYSMRSVTELGTFVWTDDGKAEAQPGCHDDLVMSLAMGVYVALEQPKQLRRVRETQHQPQFSVTGY